MMTSKFAVLAVAAAALVTMTGCATREQTGALVGAVAGGFLGAGVGAGAGSVIGGVVGAGLGGLVGGAVGKHFDRHDHMMVKTAVETNTTQTWTTKDGASASASTVDTGTDKKELTVTRNGDTEKSTIVKKNGKWIKE